MVKFRLSIILFGFWMLGLYRHACMCVNDFGFDNYDHTKEKSSLCYFYTFYNTDSFDPFSYFFDPVSFIYFLLCQS